MKESGEKRSEGAVHRGTAMMLLSARRTTAKASGWMAERTKRELREGLVLRSAGGERLLKLLAR